MDMNSAELQFALTLAYATTLEIPRVTNDFSDLVPT